MANPIKALVAEREDEFRYKVWFDHKHFDAVKAVEGTEQLYHYGGEEHMVYISHRYLPPEVLMDMQRVIDGGKKRLCNIKVEQCGGFSAYVWCDDEMIDKMMKVGGVATRARGYDGSQYITIDHRYDPDAVVAEIMALDK
jgi:hypothetical protein